MKYSEMNEEQKIEYRKKQLQYYEINKEKIRIRNQKYFEKYYEEHRDEILEKYRKTDNHKLTEEERKERQRQYKIKWYNNNKDYFLQKARYYRSKTYIHNKRGILFSTLLYPNRTNGVFYSEVELDFEE